MSEMTLPSRHRIRNSNPGCLRSRKLPLGHRSSISLRAPAGICPVVRTYDDEEWGVGGGGDYNLTVIIQSKRWIYNIYNLFIIYITLFIIGITLLMIDIIFMHIFKLYIIDIFIVIR